MTWPPCHVTQQTIISMNHHLWEYDLLHLRIHHITVTTYNAVTILLINQYEPHVLYVEFKHILFLFPHVLLHGQSGNHFLSGAHHRLLMRSVYLVRCGVYVQHSGVKQMRV